MENCPNATLLPLVKPHDDNGDIIPRPFIQRKLHQDLRSLIAILHISYKIDRFLIRSDIPKLDSHKSEYNLIVFGNTIPHHKPGLGIRHWLLG